MFTIIESQLVCGIPGLLQVYKNKKIQGDFFRILKFFIPQCVEVLTYRLSPQPSSFCSGMALDIGHHIEHHVYHVGKHHRLSVQAGVLLGIGTVCSKDEAGVLE
jgi:hypothetical protein